MPMLSRATWLLRAAVLVLITTPAVAIELAPDASDLELRETLAIHRVGEYGRAPVHTDAIEALIVAGTWKPPAAGDSITLPDGSTRTWEAVTAGEDGWITSPLLRGGYAYAAVESPVARVMLLEASGHSLVYVNGEPRAGDPYQTGYVRLPIQLRAGTNDFLFASGRGRLQARLHAPESTLLIDLADATLPDLIVGESVDVWGAVVVLNARPEPLSGAHLTAEHHSTQTWSPLPSIPAMSLRKVGFRIRGPALHEAGDVDLKLKLRPGEPADGPQPPEVAVKLAVRSPAEARQRTFVSAIDGSVQYYAVQPADPAADTDEPPALFLTLHGAGVEASGQARAYARKQWGHVVAPTNRRPYGFDWEDWGRLDALEVLDLATAALNVDPHRVYLVGHSMGGHGTWHVGLTHPDRFAAIGPSAGWVSFWSYSGAAQFEDDSPLHTILRRALNPSDTLRLVRNSRHFGVYILHGDQDDNVPVAQARIMREQLGGFHTDFAYYERPGAGHWWGNECVDWPPLFEYLRRHERPRHSDVRRLEFITANPATSATCYWATIEAQLRALDFSRIDLTADSDQRHISGTTENVARLSLALARPAAPDETDRSAPLEPGLPLTVILDDQELPNIPWPRDGQLRAEFVAGTWQVAVPPSAARKGPHRGGPFKQVFNNRVRLVYGTMGLPAENAWAYAKARYDAETLWYRGNSSVELVADTELNLLRGTDHNLVLYGNAVTNAAWSALFSESPVQIRTGAVHVGGRVLKADNLAVLAVYPRLGSDSALVGVIGGSGLTGMRLTDRLPYFLSGVAYPDWIVLGPEILSVGTRGIRATGFYDNNWQLDEDQSAWGESANHAP